MGVRTVTVTSATCDHCNVEMTEGQIWIDYGEAGLAFHWHCLREMSALEFIRAAHEGGDQMWVHTNLTNLSYHNELKHLHWEGNEDRLEHLLKSS